MINTMTWNVGHHEQALSDEPNECGGKGRLQANEKGMELRCGDKGWPWFDNHICDGIICKEHF
jgi:hypothetical protein